MALFSEWMQRCAKKVLDNAGYVNDESIFFVEVISLLLKPIHRAEPGVVATSFSTSTQPKCRPASFAPVSVRAIFPGLTL